jgi:hypothetical protein
MPFCPVLAVTDRTPMTCAIGNPGNGGANSVSCCDIEFASPEPPICDGHQHPLLTSPSKLSAPVTQGTAFAAVCA